ncbi:hypothetical protein B0A52_06394 [Exophiala mesophila]|uniref:6-methylsalicylate decarboxylase n=1 Tax=Exophiala mesophila TaxID=212818 RepID=A0A438N1Y9_EXOME|nr:hypothetical protein B0A52_06394 [Exophiala mesophila]
MAISKVSSFRVDVHTHPIPDIYREALVNAGYEASNVSEVFVDGFRTPYPFTIEGYLDARREQGYNFSILSITAPGVSFLHGNFKAQELARTLNDEMHQYIQAHPTQLGAFGILPLPDLPSSLEEIRYCLDELGFEGIGLYTNYDGKYLGDSFLDPIFEELNQRQATVFVHPTNPPTSPPLQNMSLPVIEYTFDTTRAIANLLFTGTRKRYPDIKFIFSHGGGALPFLADRLGIQSTLPFHGGRDLDESLAELKGYYYDTAVVLGEPQFAALKALVGADKLLTGSDYPYLPASLVPMAQVALTGFEGFDDAEKEKVDWRNAFELFPTLRANFPELE